MNLSAWNRCATWLTISRKSAVALAVLLSGVAGAFAQGTLASVNHANRQTPPSVLNGTAKLVEHYNPSQKLRLAFSLKPPHLDEERQLAIELHDKKSPQFPHCGTVQRPICAIATG
jgi:hypothetical protein